MMISTNEHTFTRTRRFLYVGHVPILNASNHRRIEWKNGRGMTLEIATDAATAGGNWSWRLSIADVVERAAFSV